MPPRSTSPKRLCPGSGLTYSLTGAVQARHRAEVPAVIHRGTPDEQTVMLPGVSCPECGRILRAQPHPGSPTRFRVVPRHNRPDPPT